MAKKEFVDAVAERAGLSRAEAERVIDAIFDTATGAISQVVHSAGSFQIPGFGKFTRRTRAARTGRNPRTGTTISIPEKTTVGFTAGSALKTGATNSRKKNALVGAIAGAMAGAVEGAAAPPATPKRSSGGTNKSRGARKSANSGGGHSDTGRSSTASTGRKAGGSGGSAAKKSGAAKKGSSSSRSSSRSR
jgi:nucleoid DNA-binding protein